MIRQAAAYATAATIGSLAGTLAGTLFGIILMSNVMNDKTTNRLVPDVGNVNDITQQDESEPKPAHLGEINLNQ